MLPLELKLSHIVIITIYPDIWYYMPLYKCTSPNSYVFHIRVQYYTCKGFDLHCIVMSRSPLRFGARVRIGEWSYIPIQINKKMKIHIRLCWKNLQIYVFFIKCSQFLGSLCCTLWLKLGNESSWQYINICDINCECINVPVQTCMIFISEIVIIEGWG